MNNLKITEIGIIEKNNTQYFFDFFGKPFEISGEKFEEQKRTPVEIQPAFWAFSDRVWQILNPEDLNKKQPELEARGAIAFYVNSLKRDRII